MEHWISDILQTKAQVLPFDRDAQLPVYLKAKYDFAYLHLDEYPCLLLKVKGTGFSIQSIKKDIERCAALSGLPVVLSFPHISTYQRNRLLQNLVPFVVQGYALYLPFLGTYMAEKMQNAHIKERGALSAMAQYVFLYLFHFSLSDISYSELARRMNIRKMSISRAITELSYLGIVEVESLGNKKLINVSSQRSKLLHQALPYLTTPIIKVVHLLASSLSESFVIAGTQALSEQSMLAERKSIVAMSQSMFNQIKSTCEIIEEEVNDERSTEVEVWRYDPRPFSRDGRVDTISLYLSLKDASDERVQSELKTLWEGMRW
jgi:DNA-binding transcriptional ArsR family regulator